MGWEPEYSQLKEATSSTLTKQSLNGTIIFGGSSENEEIIMFKVNKIIKSFTRILTI